MKEFAVQIPAYWTQLFIMWSHCFESSRN